VNIVGDLLQEMRGHADLLLGAGDDAGDYVAGVLLAIAGLTARGMISEDVAAALLDPYDHDGVLLAAFSGSDASETDLYAQTVSTLAEHARFATGDT
jgi:hypothetical protein